MSIPRTFCITLKETPKRRKEAQKYFDDIGLKVEFFDGAYGESLSLKTTSSNLIEFNKDDIFITSGAIGCCLSHFLLWNICNYLPENEYLIIEDDAIFCENFLSNKFELFYKQLPPDWEFVNVGWIPYGNDESCRKISENISIRIPSGTQAYLIKKSIIPYLIKSFYPVQYPLDLMLINRVFPNIKHYVFDPSLVSQKSYLNWHDPVWMSLIYDWKTDHYRVMSEINKNVSFGKGWFQMEVGDKHIWRWSYPKFEFKFTKKFPSDRIGLIFSSVKKNVIEFIDDNNNKQKFYISAGDNEIEVLLNKALTLKGEVLEKFVPRDESPGSEDDRVLGICLSGIYILLDGKKVVISISKLS